MDSIHKLGTRSFDCGMEFSRNGRYEYSIVSFNEEGIEDLILNIYRNKVGDAKRVKEYKMLL